MAHSYLYLEKLEFCVLSIDKPALEKLPWTWAMEVCRLNYCELRVHQQRYQSRIGLIR